MRSTSVPPCFRCAASHHHDGMATNQVPGTHAGGCCSERLCRVGALAQPPRTWNPGSSCTAVRGMPVALPWVQLAVWVGCFDSLLRLRKRPPCTTPQPCPALFEFCWPSWSNAFPRPSYSGKTLSETVQVRPLVTPSMWLESFVGPCARPRFCCCMCCAGTWPHHY